MFRKGAGVPSTSYPSRQRKLGPAPFASFEDLSDEVDAGTSDHQDSRRVQPMPEIKEDGIRTPEEEIPIPSRTRGSGSSAVSTPGPNSGGFATPHSMPTSGPTSGLQTPSTPRIDISCASSSTPPSDDSNSEKELFQGGLGFAFHEEGTEDLRSSTEELDLGEDDLEEESSKKKNKEPDDPLRRASHPANIFNRKASLTPEPDPDFVRKPSAHSLYLDGFLRRPSRHHSFGSADYARPGAMSSLSMGSGKRSPSPHKMLLETSFCGNKPIPTPSIDLDSPPKELVLASALSRGKMSSDSSFEGHNKPISSTTLTTVQVHHHDQPISWSGSDPSGPSSHRCPSPGSPKSSDHWRPISPRTPKIPQMNPEPWVSPSMSPGDERVDDTPSSSPKVGPQVGTQCTTKRTDVIRTVRTEENSSVDPRPGMKVKDGDGRQNAPALPPRPPGLPPPPPPASFDIESDEITTELNISEEPTVTVQDVPKADVEAKGFYTVGSPDDDYDGDLPFIPTTLPQEKSSVVPIISVKERKKLGLTQVTTTPVQRPRCARPVAPATLNDYIAYSTVPRVKANKGEDSNKMKISLPREDSLSDAATGGPKKRMSTSWTDFAEMGLRSPREIRRRMKAEENGADGATTNDVGSYHSDSSPDTAGPVNGSDEEVESLLKPPVVPFAMDLDVKSNRSSALSQDAPRTPQSPRPQVSPDVSRDRV